MTELKAERRESKRAVNRIEKLKMKKLYEQGYFDGHMDLRIAIDKIAKRVYENRMTKHSKVRDAKSCEVRRNE